MIPGVTAAPGSVGLDQETIDLIRTSMADVTRAGITTATGLEGYELEAPAKVINPVITPLVNMIPRKQGSGNGQFVHWKAITSFDTGRVSGVNTEGALPSSVAYQEADMQNLYATIALMNSVSFQAQWRGQSLEGDVRAKRVGELLYQLKIVEERWILGASSLLMVPPRPLLATAATGGSVAAATYWVQITAINGNGETTASAATSITTTGATSTITVTIFTVPWATGYNVYIGSGASLPATSAMWLQASISGNTNAAQPGYNASVTVANGGNPSFVLPSGEVVGPTKVVTLTAAVATSGTALSTVAANTAKSFVDANNGNLLMWDGLIAQALNNATTANGLTLGAQVGVPAAATGLLALSDIQQQLTAAYLQAAGDPDFLVCNPLVANQITNLTIAAGQTRYVVEANQPGTSGKLTAQYRVTHYLNQATGKEMPIIQDRYCPVDTVIGLPMSMPYPVNGLDTALEIETNRNYWGVDYALTDNSWKFGDMVDEAFKVYHLGALTVLRGITPSN